MNNEHDNENQTEQDPEDHDWWKRDPQEKEYEIPETQFSNEPTPTLEELIEHEVADLLLGKGWYPRKLVEDYMKLKQDPQQGLNFLHLMLDMMEDGTLYPEEPMTESKLPPLTDEEKAAPYTLANAELEKMLRMDISVSAVELLRARGQ